MYFSCSAWDTSCQPKFHGGLGLRKSDAINPAFLAKLGWKIMSNPNNLWVQSVTAKYLCKSQFLTYCTQPRDFWIWKKILQIHPLLISGLRLDPDQIANIDITVDMFITDNNTWDVPLLLTVLPNNIVQTIRVIPLPSSPILDEPCWGLFKDDQFTVKSATWLAHSHWLSCIPQIHQIHDFPLRLNSFLRNENLVPFLTPYTFRLRHLHCRLLLPPYLLSRGLHPHSAFVNLIFDGSANQNSTTASVVIRDHLGNHVTSRTYNLGSSSAFLAKTIALRKGPLLAKEFIISDIFIEGDNLTVINILQGHFICPWKLQLLMADVKAILDSFTSFQARQIYREGNRAADYVASLGYYRISIRF
ncbi:uncharacterized protein LOC110710438 [Chenopodium quinoa]|uniref:uncharacterized protein LOC110710438 n=1 Tax=Chenopodium quinoa TaxID=63459 RepID=UPI000B76B987|nr:uncharacterized protein LOC110710438 [Chenopodium quinoa]